MFVKEVDIQNFDSVVINADKPVLVDFNAAWCGPCQMLKPVIEQIAEQRSDITVASVNVDENASLAARFGVNAIPCLVLIRNGEEVDRSVGFVSAEQIEDMLG